MPGALPARRDNYQKIDRRSQLLDSGVKVKTSGWLFRACCVGDQHVKRDGTARNGRANSPQPNDTQARTRHFPAQRHGACGPATEPNVLVGLHDLTADPQHQAHRQVRHVICQHSWRMSHHHATVDRGWHINAVIAHAKH